MALKFYRSATDEGGAIGDQIASGDVNALFPEIDRTKLVTGTTLLRKIWIEADAEKNIFTSIYGYGAFFGYVFVSDSGNDNDTTSDLTGNEPRYGAMKVVSNTDTSIVLEKDANHDLIRVNDKFYIDYATYSATGITDNGDGTVTVDIDGSFSGNDYSGDHIHTGVQLSFLSGQKRPYWIEQKVPPGSQNVGVSFNTITLLTVY